MGGVASGGDERSKAGTGAFGEKEWEWTSVVTAGFAALALARASSPSAACELEGGVGVRALELERRIAAI